MKPTIKDTPKDLEDKPPNKGQVESTLVYTLNRKSPLKEDNLSIKDKTASPEVRGSTVSVFLFIKRVHYYLTFQCCHYLPSP